MKILITGFEPFGGDSTNPAWDALELIPDEIGGAEIVKQLLPTSFKRGGDVLLRAIEAVKPDAVICVGLASGRKAVTVERVAINIMDSAAADNDGFAPTDEPIIPGAPAAYFSTLPIKKIVTAINDLSIPAAISNSAGTFVCNATLFRLLHSFSPATFIHVPSTSTLPLTTISKALTAALVAVIES